MSDSLTFRLLRYIQASAETLNFTRAAEQVFVAQSSLSHQVKKFENEVELLFFERLQNGLKLTPAGRIVATFAENTLSEISSSTRPAMQVSYRSSLRLSRSTKCSRTTSRIFLQSNNGRPLSTLSKT